MDEQQHTLPLLISQIEVYVDYTLPPDSSLVQVLYLTMYIPEVGQC